MKAMHKSAAKLPTRDVARKEPKTLRIHRRVSYRSNPAANTVPSKSGPLLRSFRWRRDQTPGELRFAAAAPYLTLDYMKTDPPRLQAALEVCENRLARINQAILEIRRALAETGTAGDAAHAPRPLRLKVPPAARVPIADRPKLRSH